MGAASRQTVTSAGVAIKFGECALEEHDCGRSASRDLVSRAGLSPLIFRRKLLGTNLAQIYSVASRYANITISMLLWMAATATTPKALLGHFATTVRSRKRNAAQKKQSNGTRI